MDEKLRDNPEISFDELWNEKGEFPLDTDESVKEQEKDDRDQ